MSVNPARLFVESFHGGDARAAVQAIARTHGIAVAMQDRADFEADLDREMTDEEFESLREFLDGFGEFLANSGARSSIEEWRYRVLARLGFHDDE